jgi:hypothetical protein
MFGQKPNLTYKIPGIQYSSKISPEFINVSDEEATKNIPNIWRYFE